MCNDESLTYRGALINQLFKLITTDILYIAAHNSIFRPRMRDLAKNPNSCCSLYLLVELLLCST